MPTDTSDSEATFSDAGDESIRRSSTSGRRVRQLSVSEMVKSIDGGQKRQKRARPVSGSPSQADTEQAAVGNEALLAAIRKMVTEAKDEVICSMNAKFESFEKRIDILEAELHTKDLEVQRLQTKVESCEKQVEALYEQIESIDMNRRQNSLIFACDEFGSPSLEENIAEKTVEIINKRFGDLRIAGGDIQTVHRLQGRNVICKFFKTDLRNALYDRRMELARRQRSSEKPLFISESLTKTRRQWFNELLAAKRAGKIYTVYSRRGAVFYKKSKEEKAVRIDSVGQLQGLLNGKNGTRTGRTPTQ